MKKLKIIITTITTLFILSISFSANAADCSGYKKFSHKWNMCKVGKIKEMGKDGTAVETVDVAKSNVKTSIWQKIKTFGGKTTGPDEQ